MATKIGSAFIEVDADSSKFSGAVAGLGKAAVAGVAVAGAAVGAFAVKGLGAFATLEQGMNEVFTLLPGITAGAMDSMIGDVRAFSREMGVTTEEVVPALYQAISAGVPQANVFDFLEVAQKAALGGVTELETAVDGISSVINAYGTDVLSAAEASDLMFTAVKLGKTTFDEMSSSLFQVIPTAAALGVGFGDVTASLAEMTKQGVPTQVATTQLRQLFVELSKEGTKTSDIFSEMAGESFADFIAGGGDVAGALDLLNEASATSGVALQDMFGSVEAGQAALALAAGGTDALRASMAEMDASAGATDAAFAQMDQGLSRTWERIKIAGKDALLTVGQSLAPFVQTIADKLLPALETAAEVFADVMEAFGEGEGVLDSLSKGFGALVDGLGFDNISWGSLFEGLQETAQTAFAALVDWLTSGGIESIVQGILAARQRLLDAALAVFPVIIEAIVTIIPQVVTTLVAAVPLIIEAAVTLLTSIIEAIPILLPLLLEGIVSLVTQLADALVTLVPLIIEGALTLFLAVVTALAEALPVILDALVGAILALVGLLPTLIPQLLDAAVTLFLALVTGILDVLPDLIDALLGDVLPALITALIASLPKLITAAIRLFMGLAEALVKVIPALIGTLVTKVIPKLLDALVKAIPAMVEAGKNLILGLGRGILSAAAGVVKSVKDKVVNAIKNLWPFSPAKEGPFAQFPPEMAGANLAKMWAEGITSGGAKAIAAAAQVTGQIQRSLSSTTLAMPGLGTPALAGAGGRSTVININMEGTGIPEVDAQRLSAAAAVVRRMETL